MRSARTRVSRRSARAGAQVERSRAGRSRTAPVSGLQRATAADAVQRHQVGLAQDDRFARARTAASARRSDCAVASPTGARRCATGSARARAPRRKTRARQHPSSVVARSAAQRTDRTVAAPATAARARPRTVLRAAARGARGRAAASARGRPLPCERSPRDLPSAAPFPAPAQVVHHQERAQRLGAGEERAPAVHLGHALDEADQLR